MVHVNGHWSGSINLEYKYTAGIAGERFFREIKEHGRIMATRCTSCKLTFLPPRLYCERCFRKLEKWVRVKSEGTLYSYTATYDKGRRSVYGFVKFKGVEGGLINKIVDAKLEKLKIGMAVKMHLRGAVTTANQKVYHK